jgi:hypothetical protein
MEKENQLAPTIHAMPLGLFALVLPRPAYPGSARAAVLVYSCNVFLVRRIYVGGIAPPWFSCGEPSWR